MLSCNPFYIYFSGGPCGFLCLNRSLWSHIICESRNISSVSSWSAGDGVRKIFTVMVIHLIESKRHHLIIFSEFSGKSDSAWFYNSDWSSVICVVHDNTSQLWGGCAASVSLTEFHWENLFCTSSPPPGGRLILETELLIVCGVFSLRGIWIIFVVLCLPLPHTPF